MVRGIPASDHWVDRLHVLANYELVIILLTGFLWGLGAGYLMLREEGFDGGEVIPVLVGAPIAAAFCFLPIWLVSVAIEAVF